MMQCGVSNFAEKSVGSMLLLSVKVDGCKFSRKKCYVTLNAADTITCQLLIPIPKSLEILFVHVQRIIIRDVI